jgi:acyl-CoA dehydrogenase
MNFQFSDEAEALREQAKRFLGDKSGRDKIRAVMDAGSGCDAALWAEIAALGWPALRIPEAHGGLGLSILDLCVLAEEVGRALTPVPFTSSVLLATEALLIAGTEAQKAHWLPKLADGSATGAVALGEGTAVPGVSSKVAISVGQATGVQATGVKAPVPDAALADFIIFSGPDGLYLVEKSASGLTIDDVETVDLARKSYRLTFNNTPVEAMAGGRGALETFLMSAAVLTAFEALGGAEAAMEMAVNYAKERVAFGRKIGGYQAVKHRLADMYIKNQLARSHAYYGAWALSTGSAELGQAAAGARLATMEAFQFAAEENIQLHGGIGFTWESDCQFFYRRARLNALLLGSKAHWSDVLVRNLEQRNTAIAA